MDVSAEMTDSKLLCKL